MLKSSPSHDAPHLHRVPYGQQSMLSVRPLSLAGRAQVIVGTHGALEASPDHGALTAVTGHTGVQGRGWAHVSGRGMWRPRWWRRRRVTKGERREGMKREVTTVLFLL